MVGVAMTGQGTEDFGRHRIRVLLADDHEFLRALVRNLLMREPDLEVIGEANSGQAAVDMVHRTHPDVVVLDVCMPGINGIEATKRILHDAPDVAVVGLSTSDDEDIAEAMYDAGSMAYLRKDEPVARLVEAIRTAARHGRGHCGPPGTAPGARDH